MKVIDMRCRPAYLHDFFGATPGSTENDTARWLNRRVGTRGNDEHYADSRTPEGFLAEVRTAGLSRAVVGGRHTPSQHLPNDVIYQIVHGHEALIGIGAVDPALQGEAIWASRTNWSIDCYTAMQPGCSGSREADSGGTLHRNVINIEESIRFRCARLHVSSAMTLQR